MDALNRNPNGSCLDKKVSLSQRQRIVSQNPRAEIQLHMRNQEDECPKDSSSLSVPAFVHLLHSTFSQ